MGAICRMVEFLVTLNDPSPRFQEHAIIMWPIGSRSF